MPIRPDHHHPSPGDCHYGGCQFHCAADCGSVLANLVAFQGGCVQGTTRGIDISRVRSDWVNGPDLATSGIDCSIGCETELLSGEFSIGARGSFTQHDLHFLYDLPFTAVQAQLQFSIENITDAARPLP